jgi:hypothetical protein
MARGQVNVANAVNVKQAVHAARSVKVVVLINYHSLEADRGRGVRDMANLLMQLFGGAERLEEHLRSVVVVISKALLRDSMDDSPVERDQIVNLLSGDSSGLDAVAARVVEALARCTVVFHPLERGPESWLQRRAILELLRAKEPIREPSAVFHTVLTVEDEAVLRETASDLCAALLNHLQQQQYAEMAKCMYHVDLVRGGS